MDVECALGRVTHRSNELRLVVIDVECEQERRNSRGQYQDQNSGDCENSTHGKATGRKELRSIIGARVDHPPRRVIRAEGPARLSPEWWLDAALPEPRRPHTRDYYRVEDEDGRRYWLFREGLYGREDAERAPGWWMHGVFA